MQRIATLPLTIAYPYPLGPPYLGKWKHSPWMSNWKVGSSAFALASLAIQHLSNFGRCESPHPPLSHLSVPSPSFGPGLPLPVLSTSFPPFLHPPFSQALDRPTELRTAHWPHQGLIAETSNTQYVSRDRAGCVAHAAWWAFAFQSNHPIPDHVPKAVCRQPVQQTKLNMGMMVLQRLHQILVLSNPCFTIRYSMSARSF